MNQSERNAISLARFILKHAPETAKLVRDGHPNYPLSKTYDAVKDEVAEHAENEIRKDFTVSERVEIGKAVEAELGKRQGQRTDLVSKEQGGLLEELSRNLDEVPQGRTDELAAKKAGFGNKDTYRQAKTVTEKAVPELVSAVDRGDVAISTAAKLANAPVEVQRNAAADPKKAVELAKSAGQQKSTEIKAAAVAIQKREMQTEMAEMRALRPARVIDVPALVLAEHAENEIRKDFTVSERVEIGKAVEAELKAIGERRGRPRQEREGQGTLVEEEIPVNLPEFESGETREIAAKKAGFGSDKTYRDAKTVTEHAEPELIAAMDNGAVAISTAAKLANDGASEP